MAEPFWIPTIIIYTGASTPHRRRSSEKLDTVQSSAIRGTGLTERVQSFGGFCERASHHETEDENCLQGRSFGILGEALASN